MMDTLNRRQFLTAGCAITAIGLGGQTAGAREARAFFRRHHLAIGLNGIMVGDGIEKNLDQTLRQVADIGYRSIEFSGFGQRPVKDVRLAADRAGLQCDCIHILGIPNVPGPSLYGNLDDLAEQAHTLGVEYVVNPFPVIPSRFSLQAQHGETRQQRLADIIHQLTVDDWKAAANFLNEKGAALKRRGLRLAYHSHNLELTQVGGETGLDILLAGTDPDLLTVEMDTGWMAAAGRDPVALLKAHPGRFHLMTLKDIAATTRPNTSLDVNMVDIGDGIIDWKAVLPAAYAAGIRHFHVDQDPPFDRPVQDVLRRNFEYLDRVMA